MQTTSQAQTSSPAGKAKFFVIVFLLLCGLTAISFGIANSSLMDNRIVAWSSMLLVSVAKALLVVLFFMHLWWEKAWKYVLTIPALIMAIMLVLLLVPDIAMRSETYSNQRRQFAPAAESVDNQLRIRSEER